MLRYDMPTNKASTSTQRDDS